MSNSTLTGSLFTYPWDLTDEGLDAALDRIVERTGCRELILTPCYHRSEYFLPHNPKHPIYFGENGAIFFSPDLSRYGRTRIRPRVSREVTDPEYFDRIVEGMERRGLAFVAWVVYTYQNYLTEQYPEFAKHDAFGTPYVGQLSTAPEDVREYVLALTEEIVDRFRPATVHIESLMRRGFPMPGKRRGEISPRCRFLLALCFNPASVAHADAEGMDGECFREAVAGWLRPRLARIADEEPVTEAWISEAFEGRLEWYLEIGRKYTTALWLEVAELIHGRGVKVQTIPADSTRALSNDLDPAINGHVDRLWSGVKERGERARGEVDALIGRIAPGGELFVPARGDLTDPAALTEEVKGIAEAGAAGVTFYNYGLLREEQLGVIGAALRSGT